MRQTKNFWCLLGSKFQESNIACLTSVLYTKTNCRRYAKCFHVILKRRVELQRLHRNTSYTLSVSVRQSASAINYLIVHDGLTSKRSSLVVSASHLPPVYRRRLLSYRPKRNGANKVSCTIPIQTTRREQSYWSRLIKKQIFLDQLEELRHSCRKFTITYGIMFRETYYTLLFLT